MDGEWVGGWMDGWMDGWTDGWMDGWKDVTLSLLPFQGLPTGR